MIKAILTKPLDGQPEGTEREFSKADFDRLEAMNAVRLADEPAKKAAPKVQNKKAPATDNKAAD
ncbi:hypothetical protein [Sinorhizobium meliloti]|uniref:hypothetical protein n=1 Tax=Rhizobium meliloti TaxID=382 RepID=UPI0019121BCC|nr:hypothetical protein [Sinorhizobium meliloti]